MPELLTIINTFSTNNPVFITWVVTTLIIILGILLQKKWLKEVASEWKLNHLLKNISRKSLHNVIVSDGMDEKIFIEHLILTPKNILLFGVKKFKGLIFAADKIDLWTQVVGNKSYKFDNPLHQLERDALALNSKLENTKIIEKVLFINGSEFPKGKPDNIVSISDLRQWKQEYYNLAFSEEMLADWEVLSELAINNTLEKEVLIHEENASGFSVASLMMMIVFITLWLSLRL